MLGTVLSHHTAIVDSGLFSALMISCSNLFKSVSGLLKSWVCKPSASLLGLILLLLDSPSCHTISLYHRTVLLRACHHLIFHSWVIWFCLSFTSRQACVQPFRIINRWCCSSGSKTGKTHTGLRSVGQRSVQLYMLMNFTYQISLPSEWSSPLSQALADKLSFGFLCWSQIHHMSSCTSRKSMQMAGHFLAPGNAFSMFEQPQYCSLKAQGWNSSLFLGKPFWLQSWDSLSMIHLSGLGDCLMSPHFSMHQRLWWCPLQWPLMDHGAKAAWRRDSDGKVLCNQGGNYLEMLLI